MKAKFQKVKEMGKARLFTLTETYLKASSKMVKDTDLVFVNLLLQALFTKVNGAKIDLRVLVCFLYYLMN